ncbi:hypothetical protein [Rurimicrobium arvi]|uniref:DUF4145 domain-containing protein n=1 Tax=Rurimicrobium arvi TaxID=2049916 RepID=A0ABP8MXW1_9BACT
MEEKGCMTLEQFITKIEGFEALPSSRKIDFFVYYLTVEKNEAGIKSKDVDACFDELKINRYSNTAQFLRDNSKKVKGRKQRFILHHGLYHLERSNKTDIDVIVNAPRVIVATDNFFPLEIFHGTRGYLKTVSEQAAACYDQGLYDACSVMTRKLLEILIIEAFERKGIDDKIKNPAGNFFYLSDLIDLFKNEATWNIGRNTKECLPRLKKIGDMSAHNRRYIAKKADLDKIKDDLRIVFDELIHLIDYPNWR